MKQELTDDQVEKLAVKHEAFGFGRVDEKGYTTHGFDPDGLGNFVRELLADKDAEIAALRLDAERYRWLRSIGRAQVSVLGHYAGDALDAATDKAMACGQDKYSAPPAPAQAVQPDPLDKTHFTVDEATFQAFEAAITKSR